MPSAEPIERGAGTTESERYLARLADHSFLNLWSYPNVFTDKKVRGAGDGKELCDLLVVCGDDVLVFSDKTISWPHHDDPKVAWRRWFKKAVIKSAAQVRGAQRWLSEFPDRIFLDRECTKPLPLPLPQKERRRIHGIIVALGAGGACRAFFRGGRGSLIVDPSIKDAQHVGTNAMPFAVGDIDSTGPFIHVLDDVTLDIVMSELDTISDLTAYLVKKEQLIRSGHLVRAAGEEDLVAHYMTHMNSADEHDFTKSDGSPWRTGERFFVGQGAYERFIRNEQYYRKKTADETSYVWDRLIEAFTTNMLAGTTIHPDRDEFVLCEHEESIRHLALVPRYLRRIYGDALLGMLEKGQTAPRMTRAILPVATDVDHDTGFFFMTLKPPQLEVAVEYEDYRQLRRRMLETYAATFLQRYPHVRRMIGVAMEPPGFPGSKQGSSEDLIMIEQQSWSPAFLEQLRLDQEAFNVVREGVYKEYGHKGKEYPDPQ